MKRNTMSAKTTIIATLALLIVMSGRYSHADVLISNIQLTETSLSFDIAGTIDIVGPTNSDSLYIGDPLNGSWNLHGFGSGILTNHAGASYTPGGAYTSSNSAGGYVYMDAGGVIQVNDTIDASFSYSGGNFVPSATDTSSWIVSAGWNGDTFILPDPAYATGYAVPEPSGLAIFLCVGALAIHRRRGSSQHLG